LVLMSRYNTLKTDHGGCTSEVAVDCVLDNITEVSFCIFLPGLGQIRKGGTRVGLGVGVLEHQRWAGFSRKVAPQISPQLQIGDLPKSRRLVHMARSLHLTICMAIWPAVVVW
ncbi:hypothetical protein BDDG_13180, partial [Blastomyces dermatitidis ATCC 18188]